MKRLILSLIAMASIAALCCSCAMLADLAAGTGLISQQQADSAKKVGGKISKVFEKLTPENEYYIGRSVAATLFHTYKCYDKDAVNRYLNLLGQTLATASTKPETYAGYHFVAMDTDEVNAFAAPGGLILVSRGLLRCCKNEDAIAAVLAHEIGHIEGDHALRAIKKGRWTDAVKTGALEAGKSMGGDNLAAATEVFGDSIGDVMGNLANNGYSRGFEDEADQSAVRIMASIGYNPTALKDMLTEMESHLKPGGLGFMKTHPSPASRIKAIEPVVKNFGPVTPVKERQARFDKAMAGI